MRLVKKHSEDTFFSELLEICSYSCDFHLYSGDIFSLQGSNWRDISRNPFVQIVIRDNCYLSIQPLNDAIQGQFLIVVLLVWNQFSFSCTGCRAKTKELSLH